jgi:transcriptional regulator with XRE-family HTH domain
MDAEWMTRARARMQASGISQSELATALGCTRGAVGHYLAGRRNPSLEQMESIARALSVDLLWLLRGSTATGIAEDTSGTVFVPLMGDTDTGAGKRPSGQLGAKVGISSCYGLNVVGGKYSPRLYAGEVAVFDAAAEPGPGDEVLVQLRNGNVGLYALVNRSRGHVTLESLAGERVRTRIAEKDIRALHKLIAVFRQGAD